MSLKSFASLLLFWCLVLPLAAQDSTAVASRPNYALLWEISGPELPGPSYVFGSMHVRYPSVFEFPDSLLHCLAASDAFANEIHLDSAMQRIFQVYLDQEELNVDSSYIRLIQEHTVQPDTSQQEEASSYTNLQSFFRNLKEGEELREGDNMPTMLDAYLMEVARRLGKTLYGLEDIDEHLYEAEDLQSVQPSQFKFTWFANNADDLLRLYYDGALEPIDAFIRAEPAGFNQLALVGRNYIMVDAMERIMAEKKLFSVVGAAHLPGKEGVLELLRQRGYQLRRVTATFTGQRDSFRIPPIARTWPVVRPQRKLYQLAMPLGVQHVYNEGANVSHLSFDMGRGLSYLVLSSSMLPYDYTNFEQIFFAEDGYDIIKKTPYRKGGIEGFSYELERPGNEVQYYQAYTFFYDEQLYYLQIGAYEKNTLQDNPDVARFINEFDLLRKNQNKWVTVTDSIGGFRVRMPATYVYSESARNEAYPYRKSMDFPWHQYRAGFEEGRASVWLQYFDVSPGSTPQRSWDQMQAAVDELETQYGIDIAVLVRDSMAGFPRWELSGEFRDKGLLFDGQVLARGNRVYLLSTVDKKRRALTKKFLPSFRLISLSSKPQLQGYTYFDEVLKLQLPGTVSAELEVLEDNLSVNERYRQQVKGLDPSTGASYEIEVRKFPPSFFVHDSLAFYEQERQAMLNQEDSLLGEELVALATSTPTKVYTYTCENDQLRQWIQLYHRGSYWVKKRMVALPEYASSPARQAFFTADEWHLPAAAPTLFSGSAEFIATQLCSADTIVVGRALKSIHPHLSFREQDLPVLKEVFLDNSWGALGLEQAASQKMVTVLDALGPQGYDLLVDIFPMLTQASLKEALLAELAQQPDHAGRDALFQVLAQSKTLSDDVSTKALASFRNNPALVIQYWANFSQLLADAREPLYTWELAAQVLAQDSLSKAPVLAARHLFMERGQERLRTWQQQGGDIPEEIFELYQLLPEAPSLLTQVQQILDRTSVDLASVEAAGYLLAKGKSLPKKKVRKILRDPQLRIPFIRELNRYDRLDLAEDRYFGTEQIARTMLVEVLVEQGIVSNVQLVDEVELLFRGDPQRAYVFSFDLDGDRSRLGVVGFFSPDANKRSFLDEGFVNYTLYTITRRRQARKAEQLLEEMKDW